MTLRTLRLRALMILSASLLISTLAIGPPLGHTRAYAQTPSLGLHVVDSQLRWSAIDADNYMVVDAYSGVTTTTVDTTMHLPLLAAEGDVSVTVAAVRDGAVVAIERLRGGAETLGETAPPPGPVSVQEGMTLLAAMAVATTPSSVHFSLPAALSSEVDQWTLYRDGAPIVSAPGSQPHLSDTSVAQGASYAYTVVLSAPEWVSAYDSSLPFIGAPSEECVDIQESYCAPIGAPPASDEVAATLGVDTEWEQVRGDLLSFIVPVEVPGLDLSSVDAASGSAGASSTTDDDAYVRHYSFIQQRFVDAPEPSWYPDYWFGGDNRGFSSYPGASNRTYVRTRVDWSASQVWAMRAASPTKRYVNRGGYLYHDSTRSVTNNSKVEFLREGSRFRIHVRHSVGNPFETWFPAIDYEWEYVMVADGGVSALGLHDGAPNYEIFYEAPYSNRHVATYRHTFTSFDSLAAPMDQKDRGWCVPAAGRPGCPGFGTRRWV